MVCASGETGWPHKAQHQHRGPETWQASWDIFLYLHPLHPVQRSHALLLAEAWCGWLVGLNEPVSESAVRNEGLALMRAAELHTVATGKPPLGLGPSPHCLQHWCRQLGIDCIPPNGESLISSKFPRVPPSTTLRNSSVCTFPACINNRGEGRGQGAASSFRGLSVQTQERDLFATLWQGPPFLRLACHSSVQFPGLLRGSPQLFVFLHREEGGRRRGG